MAPGGQLDAGAVTVRVHIVIEWLGNSQTVDGATIHGVYSERGKAEAAAQALIPADVEIIDRTLDEEVTHGDDGH